MRDVYCAQIDVVTFPLHGVFATHRCVVASLEVATFLSAGQTFTGSIEAVLPVRFATDLDEDVAAHEVGCGISKTAFVIQQRRGVHVASAS